MALLPSFLIGNPPRPGHATRLSLHEASYVMLRKGRTDAMIPLGLPDSGGPSFVVSVKTTPAIRAYLTKYFIPSENRRCWVNPSLLREIIFKDKGMKVVMDGADFNFPWAADRSQLRKHGVIRTGPASYLCMQQVLACDLRHVALSDVWLRLNSTLGKDRILSYLRTSSWLLIPTPDRRIWLNPDHFRALFRKQVICAGSRRCPLDMMPKSTAKAIRNLSWLKVGRGLLINPAMVRTIQEMGSGNADIDLGADVTYRIEAPFVAPLRQLATRLDVYWVAGDIPGPAPLALAPVKPVVTRG
jgi:hypothetical protein